MSQTALSILVQETYLSRFAEIVESCRNAGMVIQRESSAIGVISGIIDTSDVAKLRDIDGLQQIEPERPLRAFDPPMGT
jgi:hypothetical protein